MQRVCFPYGAFPVTHGLANADDAAPKKMLMPRATVIMFFIATPPLLNHTIRIVELAWRRREQIHVYIFSLRTFRSSKRQFD